MLVMLVNLIVAFPSWAEIQPSSIGNPDYFQIGQRVTWLYKARADSGDVHKISGEVVKLGSKRVLLKIHKNNSEFITRWVNRDRLENSHNVIKPQ